MSQPVCVLQRFPPVVNDPHERMTINNLNNNQIELLLMAIIIITNEYLLHNHLIGRQML